jgi:hypothetical protein
MRTILSSWRLIGWCLIGAAAMAGPVAALADDGCDHFSWDVSHELAVMKQPAKPVTAATKGGPGAPALDVDKVYELKLSAQSGVTYVVKPAKPTLDDSAQGGIARFHIARAGLYRVSITSGHWIDVIDGQESIKSKDFQGARGCERPHKIVEFELPANKDLVLQLSGSTDASVILAITPAAPH